jgi:membrane protein
MLKSQLLSFLLILGSAGLLLVSLAFSTLATATKGILAGTKSAEWFDSIFAYGIQAYVSFGVIVVLFAMIFRFLPDAKISLRDVWFGAIVTSVLFELGKSMMAFYLGRTAISSFYGAAASIFVLMLWNNYTAQVFLYGAEITKAYARHNGRVITIRHGVRGEDK